MNRHIWPLTFIRAQDYTLLSLKVDQDFVFLLEDLGPILAVMALFFGGGSWSNFGRYGRYGYYGLNINETPVIYLNIKDANSRDMAITFLGFRSTFNEGSALHLVSGAAFAYA